VPTGPAPRKRNGVRIALIVGGIVVVLIAAAIVFIVVAKPFSPQAPQKQAVTAPVVTAPDETAPEKPATDLDEETIRNTLSFKLDLFKNSNSRVWQEALDAEGGELEELGVDVEAFIVTWTDGFDYKIGAIAVDGNTATAEVAITCKQIYSVMTNVENLIVQDASLGELSEEELNARVMQLLMEELGKAKPSTVTIVIPFEKSEGIWLESDGAEELLTNALLGEY
jgi:hypothetical protein